MGLGGFVGRSTLGASLCVVDSGTAAEAEVRFKPLSFDRHTLRHRLAAGRPSSSLSSGNSLVHSHIETGRCML